MLGPEIYGEKLLVYNLQYGPQTRLTRAKGSFFLLHKIGSYHWQVPVSISSSVNPRESVASTLLDQTSCTVTVNGVAPDQWVKVCILVPCGLRHVHIAFSSP